MFSYSITKGTMSDAEGVLAVGYSGHGEGKNNLALVAVHDVGPIPIGRYIIGPPEDGHGGFALRLTPKPGTDTHGRGGFLIHGDSISQPGTASLGCIILPRKIREQIWASGDRDLEVTT